MAESPSFDDTPTLPELDDADLGDQQSALPEEAITGVFMLCARGDETCAARAVKYGVPMLAVSTVRVNDGRRLFPSTFAYTTPSVRKARGQGWTKKEREAFCQMVEAYVFDDEGKKKRITKFTGRLKDGVKIDARCKGSQGSLSDPCSGNKGKKAGSCPVELVFVDGVGHLRLCETPKKGGKLLRFESRDEAITMGREACLFWRKHKTFEGLPMAQDAPFGGVDADPEPELDFSGFKVAAEMLEP